MTFNPLVEALQNVRSGRLALKYRVPTAAKYHLSLARYWLNKARERARFTQQPLTRCERVWNHINRYAVEVVAAETATNNERTAT